MDTITPEVTICVVPRERFSCAVDSLKDIVHNTKCPYELVYVDGNSPPSIASQLSNICDINHFTYIRQDHYLSPNAARNIALSRVKTPYAAFADNDLFVSGGWLSNLLQCAKETGAWAVGPVVMEGSKSLPVVHIAGGDLVEDKHCGYNRVRQRHRHMHQTLGSVRSQLTREAVGSFEFHCVLLRTDVFDDSQFLDEGFLSHQEHLDHAREIKLAGGTVYFEPSSIVRYDVTRPFEEYDREYFLLRWSEGWSSKSIEYAKDKWGLAPDDAGMARLAAWTAGHRGLFERSHTSWARWILPILTKRYISLWLRRLKLMPRHELR